MGAVVASMELENAVDRGMSAQGLRDESTVRRTRVDGIVDTGAVTLVLPQNVVERLGLATHRHRHLRRREEGRAPCRRARDRADRRPFHEYGCDRRAAALGAVDRSGDPRGLDLIADRAKQALYPRVPDYPLLNLKRLRAACPKTGRDGRSTPPRPRAAEALRACLLYRACPEGEAAVPATR